MHKGPVHLGEDVQLVPHFFQNTLWPSSLFGAIVQFNLVGLLLAIWYRQGTYAGVGRRDSLL